MIKEKGQEIQGKTTETGFGAKIPTEPPPVVEPKPPTAEEQMATLQQQLQEVQIKAEQAEKGLRSAQATLTQKDRLLKEKENYSKRFESIEDSMQILAGLIAKREIDPEEAATYKQEFAALKAKREQEEKQEALRLRQEEYNQKADAIWDKAQKIITNKKDLKMIELLLINGKTTDAEDLIVDAEKEKTPVDEKKPTDEKDKKIETLSKEIDKLKKLVSGELDTETGLPSGASANEAQIRKTFRENPDSAKARQDFLDWQRNKKK